MYSPEELLKIVFEANELELLFNPDDYEIFNMPTYFKNLKGHIKKFTLSFPYKDEEIEDGEKGAFLIDWVKKASENFNTQDPKFSIETGPVQRYLIKLFYLKCKSDSKI